MGRILNEFGRQTSHYHSSRAQAITHNFLCLSQFRHLSNWNLSSVRHEGLQTDLKQEKASLWTSLICCGSFLWMVKIQIQLNEAVVCSNVLRVCIWQQLICVRLVFPRHNERGKAMKTKIYAALISELFMLNENETDTKAYHDMNNSNSSYDNFSIPTSFLFWLWKASLNECLTYVMMPVKVYLASCS